MACKSPEVLVRFGAILPQVASRLSPTVTCEALLVLNIIQIAEHIYAMCEAVLKTCDLTQWKTTTTTTTTTTKLVLGTMLNSGHQASWESLDTSLGGRMPRSGRTISLLFPDQTCALIISGQCGTMDPHLPASGLISKCDSLSHNNICSYYCSVKELWEDISQ